MNDPSARGVREPYWTLGRHDSEAMMIYNVLLMRVIASEINWVRADAAIGAYYRARCREGKLAERIGHDEALA